MVGIEQTIMLVWNTRADGITTQGTFKFLTNIVAERSLRLYCSIYDVLLTKLFAMTGDIFLFYKSLKNNEG